VSANTICDTHKNTPLTLVTTLSQPQTLRILLESDEVDVDACDGRGWTALMLAAWRGEYEKVRDILDYGFANPFIQDRFGHTARSLAERDGYNNVVQLLVAAETTARASAAAERRRNLQKLAQGGAYEVIEISNED
jgi:ankyrin repeat protein